jgi:hypothetical protein
MFSLFLCACRQNYLIMTAASYSGTVPAGEIKVILNDAENEREMFMITNMGGCALRFGRGFSGFDMGSRIKIEAGQIITLIAHHLGGADCTHLNVENAGGAEGSYRVVRSG